MFFLYPEKAFASPKKFFYPPKKLLSSQNKDHFAERCIPQKNILHPKKGTPAALPGRSQLRCWTVVPSLKAVMLLPCRCCVTPVLPELGQRV